MIKGYLSWMILTLVEMLGGGEVDGLMKCFEAEFTLAFVNVNGLGGGGGGGGRSAERANRFKQLFASDTDF